MAAKSALAGVQALIPPREKAAGVAPTKATRGLHVRIDPDLWDEIDAGFNRQSRNLVATKAEYVERILRAGLAAVRGGG